MTRATRWVLRRAGVRVKLKLDENLGRDGQQILSAAGHDVVTGSEQRLDRELIEHCRAEGRCLVTFDLDFANPLVFLLSSYPGIAVLRIPQKVPAANLLTLIQTFADALKVEQFTGKLWIVEIGRIRVYEEEADE